MPGLLRNVPVSDDQRRANDRHNLWVVAAVLVLLFLYLYLFTYAADWFDWPRPRELARDWGVNIAHVFDGDGNVDSVLNITLTQRFDHNDDERLVLFLLLAGAFLSAYFLPLPAKQPALIVWTGLAVLILYGFRATAGLLWCQLWVYLILHPRWEKYGALILGCGLLGYFAVLAPLAGSDWAVAGFLLALSCLGAYLGYRFLFLPLLRRPAAAAMLRTAAVQSAILTVGLGALVEGWQGRSWSLPLGVLLFFWQWERLIMYHVDYKDGQVPQEIPLWRFLAVFWNPGVLPNWNWGVTIGQGYAYVHNNFLCEDKNKLVLDGVKILLIALLYLLFWNWVRHLLVDFFTGLGVPVYRAFTREMVRHFMRGEEIGTASVLATTFLDLTRWTMLWAGVVHFKVGIWRICGYRMDPYINKPWLATDLATFWSRFTFHYREFLVRAFYYPVFFRCFRKRPYLRVFVATMAAAAFGNLVWGHVTERLYYRGLEWEHVVYVLGTWPYFVLLGIGIALSQIYLLKFRRRRRPWTLDRWLWKDVLAAYCMLQFYALIHIFARPAAGSTTWDLTRLFLRGFGIQLTG
ncbi:MAG TPA: hypothetical protein ENI90_00760 [Methylothermaceae bacterium]|nr:hypothetical protein [Methylothermaceae bacterium]